MAPFTAILLGSALMTAASHPLQIPQIKRNSQRVVEWFGTASGLESFGCNDASIAYIDGFLSRQAATLTQDDKTTERVVNLIGSFVGQCVVTVYNGRWVADGTGVHVEIKSGQWTRELQPFEKVSRRLRMGESESLLPYYRDVMATVFNDLPDESASAEESASVATP